MAGIRPEHPFSLTRGGPFFHVLTRCHLVDARGHARWVLLALAAWLPVVIGAVVQLAVTRHVDPILSDPTMHVRLLVTVPLLVLAEHVLELRAERAIRHVREESIAERASVDAIVDRAEHLRDSRLVEGAIAAVVLLLGQAAVWHVGGWGEVVSGHSLDRRFSFSTIWCLAIALPFVQFLMFRWLWRWVVWTYVLARLSRLPLSLNALHPDQAAGLKVLDAPIDGFAVFNAAIASIASAAWTTRILEHHATIESLTPIFFAAFVIATIVACGPLLLFSRELYRARHRDATAYHALAREYVDGFRRKWLDDHPHGELLGNPDFQSLSDVGGSFKTADKTRALPFGARAIVSLWAGAVAPLVPLVVVTTPISEAAKHFGKMLFGVAG
jgi:hypothetical protein